MTDTEIDKTDRIVIGTSTLLILFGVVVLGIIEMLDGEPYVAQPMTNDAGEIIAQPGVDPAIRTGLVMAGVALFALYGLYKVVSPDSEPS